MAFHVACPITCRRICFCKLGFPKGLQSEKSKSEFLVDVNRIQEFLKDPYGFGASNHTIQVSVPKVVPIVAPPLPHSAAGDEEEASVSALQNKAAAAVRRFETGDVAVRDSNHNVASTDVVKEERGLSGNNIMCRMCFLGESEGSERARKMLSCKSCGKKYHRNCIKSWAKHRDLFHWSSWTCPSCRICEICRRTGDPNKFMFCKRCDGAFHCYCQHPPHKNVSSGPWLCTNHTKCHSCGSNVPGNGLSVRWFLGYTCCDACGRLFVKGNYCPVCLKVYRDSESTPMVCCDICQRWVHCHCDGISDEKYLQFQVDGDLQYKCPTCRGECYRVKDLEDAVQELWRRKDMEDRDLIASLRDAAGLPTEDDVFYLSPYSDDEDNGPATGRSEFGRSVKLSLKGLVDKSPKKSKEYGKKPSNKKYAKKKSFPGKTELRQQEVDDYEHSLDDTKFENVESRIKGGPGQIAGTTNHYDGVRSVNQPGGLKQKFVDEVMINDEEKTPRVVKIKTSRPHDLHNGDDAETHSSKAKSVKTKKLVINLGPRKLNVTNSPRSDASSCQREQDLKTSNGDEVDLSGSFKGLKFARREGTFIKFGKVKSEASAANPKFFKGSDGDGHATVPLDHLRVSSRRTGGGSSASVGPAGEVPTLRIDKITSGKHSEDRADAHTESNDDSGDTPILHSLRKDSKFSLKLKIKKPNLENQNSRISQPDDEKSSIRGQRSKRSRPSYLEKPSFNKDEDTDVTHSLDSEMMEASWIIKKLGRDAIGKRVEVHHPSDNTWHKGMVSDIVESTSMVSVSLDDGRVNKLELGKQAVRFVPQKQKR